MDKYEFGIKSDQIKKMVLKKEYKVAAKIADTIDWSKVKSNSMLITVADAYEADRQYDKAKNVLLEAYNRTPMGRQLAYRLSLLSIKLKDYIDAEDFYEDFVEMAPMDSAQYILRYKIKKAQGANVYELIAILEKYNSEDMDERWGYELAKLYEKAGEIDKCVEQCDEISLWFNEGDYVDMAMELKKQYKPLTRGQQERYDRRFERNGFSDELIYDGALEEQLISNAQDNSYVAGDVAGFVGNEMNVYQSFAGDNGNGSVPDEFATKRIGSIREALSNVPVNPLGAMPTMGSASVFNANVPRDGYNEEGMQEELANNLKQVMTESDDYMEGQMMLDFDSMKPGQTENLNKQITGQLSLEEVLKDLEARGILGESTVDATFKAMEASEDAVKEAAAETALEAATKIAAHEEAKAVAEYQNLSKLNTIDMDDADEGEVEVDNRTPEEVALDEVIDNIPEIDLTEEILNGYADVEEQVSRDIISHTAELSNLAAAIADMEGEKETYGDVDIKEIGVPDESVPDENKIEKENEDLSENETLSDGEKISENVNEAETLSESADEYEVKDELEPESDLSRLTNEELSDAIDAMLPNAEAAIEAFAKDVTQEGNIDISGDILETKPNEELKDLSEGTEVKKEKMSLLDTQVIEDLDPKTAILDTKDFSVTAVLDGIDKLLNKVKEVNGDNAEDAEKKDGGDIADIDKTDTEKTNENESDKENEKDALEVFEPVIKEAHFEDDVEAVDLSAFGDEEDGESTGSEEVLKTEEITKAEDNVNVASDGDMDETASVAVDEDTDEAINKTTNETIDDISDESEDDNPDDSDDYEDEEADAYIPEDEYEMEEIDIQPKKRGLFSTLFGFGKKERAIDDEDYDVESENKEAEPESVDNEEVETEEVETEDAELGTSNIDEVEARGTELEKVESEDAEPESKEDETEKLEGKTDATLETENKEAESTETIAESSDNENEKTLDESGSEIKDNASTLEIVKENETESLSDKIIDPVADAVAKEAEEAFAKEFAKGFAMAAANGEIEGFDNGEGVELSEVEGVVADSSETIIPQKEEEMPQGELEEKQSKSEHNESELEKNKNEVKENETELEDDNKELESDERIFHDEEPEEERKEEAIKEDDNPYDLANEEEVLDAKEPKEDSKKERYGDVDERYADFFTKEEEDLFSNFVNVSGLQNKIIKTIINLTDEYIGDGASTSGNIVVMGDEKSGKTTLAIDILKTVNKRRERVGRKIAKVGAEVLNKKGIAQYMQKLIGSDLIIEHAGILNERAIDELIESMQYYTDDMIVVLEDEGDMLTNILSEYPDLDEMFDNQIVVKDYDINEWVDYAKKYAKEQGYIVDELGTLALYARIDEEYGLRNGLSEDDIEDIMELVIKKASRKMVRRGFDKVFAKNKYDGNYVLKESDFM